MAYAGILKAQEDLGIEFDYVSPMPSVISFLWEGSSETEEYDLLIAGRFRPAGGGKREIMEEFPDQRIALVDGTEEITV